MALLPCVEEIEQKFGQLEGITFRGFFVGQHYVEQTDTYLQTNYEQMMKTELLTFAGKQIL